MQECKSKFESMQKRDSSLDIDKHCNFDLYISFKSLVFFRIFTYKIGFDTIENDILKIA